MRHGFTLIELMIVIAIIAIIAAIAIPSLLEARVSGNETKAAADLKNGFHAAQTIFANGASSDVDGDGKGEFATDHRWLAGSTGGTTVGTNTSTRPVQSLSALYNVADQTAIGAYRYKIDTDTAAGTNNDYNNGESFWAGYASPVSVSQARRGFAIDVQGFVLASKASVTDANLIDIANYGGAAATGVKMFGGDPTTGAFGTGADSAPYQK